MSVDALHRALFAFWSSFSVTAVDGSKRKVNAYLTGKVPDDAEFPYITFDVARGDALSSNFLVAQDWHRAVPGTDVNINAERTELMDAIAEAIAPIVGTPLELSDGGLIWLFRNDAAFQDYQDDPNDSAVIGGHTSYMVKYYFC